MANKKDKIAKPFLKWAGGKGSLIEVISRNFPKEILDGIEFTYIEPFVGSGALLFHIINNFPNVNRIIINDKNPDLSIAYKIIKENPEQLIESLKQIKEEYENCLDENQQRNFYYKKRELFNQRNSNDILNSALLIFLNKTCFNGLYRVNKNGGFNVPFGRYKNPKIFDEETIKIDSQALQKVDIINNDFQDIESNTEEFTLYYLDPPYKPISKTSSFTAYSIDNFNDDEQKRLKEFCDRINQNNKKFLLSNSDLTNGDLQNNFFNELYAEYNIIKVLAPRSINSKGEKRGKIPELLIANYDIKE